MNDHEKISIMKRIFIIAAIVGGLVVAGGGSVGAHGGDDHGTGDAGPVSIAGAVVDQLTTYGTSEEYELLLKYPAPEVDEPARLRFFISDYATNRPVSGATFVLASKPSGVTAKSPPNMVAPGIYDVVVTFPEDTIYDLTATIAAGSHSGQVAVGHVYAGEAAEHFLAEHAPVGAAREVGDSGVAWWVWGLAAVGVFAVVAGVVAVTRRKGRDKGNGKGNGKLNTESERAEVMTTSMEENR